MTCGHHAIAMAFLFALGAAVGSFLNVCVHRIPLGRSVLRPASRCPSCSAAIAPRDNVPILGWLLLRGRCRRCGSAISPRYPIVEAAVGLLLVAPYAAALIDGRGDPLEPGPASAAWRLLDALALASFLVVGGLIALDSGRVPASIASAGIVAAILLGAIRPGLPLDGLRDALAGLLVAGGAAFLVASAGRQPTRASILDPGDLTFAATVGAFVGLRAVVPVLAVAALIAQGGAFLTDRRRSPGSPPGRPPLPPGFALGLAGLLPLFAGPWIGIG